MRYVGKKYTKVEGTRVAKIALQDFRRLADKARAAKFFELEEDYGYIENADGSATLITDGVTTITRITRAGVTKTVTNSLGGPKVLHDFEQLIDKITGSRRWTGRWEHQDVPYYEELPVGRRITLRALVQRAGAKGRQRYILTLIHNPEFSVLEVEPGTFRLARYNDYIVDASGFLRTDGRGEKIFKLANIVRVRRYEDSQ